MMRKYRKVISICLIAGLLAAVLAAGYALYLQRIRRPLQIILVQKAIDETDFWVSVSKGAEIAARENGVELTIWGPASERETQDAHRLIEDAIEARPDAIALAPISYDETLPYARMIEEAGIPLILIDSVMAEPAGDGQCGGRHQDGAVHEAVCGRRYRDRHCRTCERLFYRYAAGAGRAGRLGGIPGPDCGGGVLRVLL